MTVTAPAQAATLTDTATVTATTADPDPTDNTSTATTTVTASADLAVTKLGPPTVTAGGSLAYTVSVTNAGPSDAANLTVTDTLPAGVTFVSRDRHRLGLLERRQRLGHLHPGGAGRRRHRPAITVTVTAPAQAGSLTNTASVASTTPDPDLTDNTSSVTTGVTGSADLAITKTGPATVQAAGTVA